MVFHVRQKLQKKNRKHKRSNQPYLAPAALVIHTPAPPSRPSSHSIAIPPLKKRLLTLKAYDPVPKNNPQSNAKLRV
jgi:hypothetical protein